MYTSDPEHTTPQLEAYALGALDAEERAAVEELLARSPEHRLELQQLRDVVGLLPFSASPVAPPAHVREQLFRRIAASQAQADSPAAAPAVARRPRRASGWAVPATLALLATLLIALGGMTLSLRQTVAGLDQTNRDLVTTLVQLERTLAETKSRQDELASQVISGKDEIDQLNVRLAQDQQIVSFLSAPGVATRTLNAAASGAGSRGEMYMYPGEASAVVVFSGLPALEPGEVYQFWLADSAGQVAGGTLVVDDTGIATLVVEAPREVNAFSQVMLTVEPMGGSAQPSQQVVLEGYL